MITMSESREELAAAIARVAYRLLSDPDVIAVVNAFARLIDEARPSVKGTGQPTRTEPRESPDDVWRDTSSQSKAPVAHAPGTITTRSDPLRPLAFASTRPLSTRTPHVGDLSDETGTIDLGAIVDRCRVKSEATRRVVERKRVSDIHDMGHNPVLSSDRDLQERASALPSCHLWMSGPTSSAAVALAADPARAESLALAFEVVAHSAELLKILRTDDSQASVLSDALHLVAEAQSALRVLVERLGASKDTDQFALYSYLREVGAEHQIYIRRHMRLEDPADPARLPELAARLSDLAQRLENDRGVNRDRRKLLSKLRYHSRLLRDGAGADADRQKVIDAAAQLVASGLPPGSPEIRDQVAPILDGLFETSDSPPEFALVRREVEQMRLLEGTSGHEHRAGTETTPAFS